VTLNVPPCCRTLTCVMPVLCMFNLQTKFEMSSFIHSKDMAWVPKCLTWGQLVIARLILHVANSRAKFEVSCCSRCRDISGGVNSTMSRDPDHAPFRDDLSSAGWDLLPLTYRSNSKFLTTPIMKVTHGHWQCYNSMERVRLPIRLQQKLCICPVLFSRYSQLFVQSRQL